MRAQNGGGGLDEGFRQTDSVREVLGRGGAVHGGGEARGAVTGGRWDGGGGRWRGGGGAAVAAAAIVVMRSERSAAAVEEEAERRGGGRHEGPGIGAAANLLYLTTPFARPSRDVRTQDCIYEAMNTNKVFRLISRHKHYIGCLEFWMTGKCDLQTYSQSVMLKLFIIAQYEQPYVHS
jgi:hypothetical protein